MNSAVSIALIIVGLVFAALFPPIILIIAVVLFINLMSKRAARNAHRQSALAAQEFARDEMRRAGARALR